MIDNPLVAVEQSPAAQDLRRRLVAGGALSFSGVAAGAQPFLAVLLQRWNPSGPVICVTEALKSQESFHQDVETWLRLGVGCVASDAGAPPGKALFYPEWEVLPLESKLPHVDVISERLETLVALSRGEELGSAPPPLVVTTAAALLQRTFAPVILRARTRLFRRGDQADPMAVAEWLQDQGYQAEAQVNHKGEFSLRGGILDLFPPTALWPARLEFFGDDLESLRWFDPLTQISKESLGELAVPPAGELSLLKRMLADKTAKAHDITATLWDYLPSGTLVLLIDPEQLAARARACDGQVPAGEPLMISWVELLEQAAAKGMRLLEVNEGSPETATAIAQTSAVAPACSPPDPNPLPPKPTATNDLLVFSSLDAFRPITERAPPPEVAEVQRREFFGQMHRWLRQQYAVHVVCNNEGERRRFAEVWEEYGFGTLPHPSEPVSSRRTPAREGLPVMHLGALTRGFLSEPARLVVVTDAEIFGRYKAQRPRRLKSPHAQTTRSVLQIDFTDLEAGDYVVHLEHGIGRYLGLQVLPVSGGVKPLEKAVAYEGGQECLVLEYAPSDPDQPAPKLYVPVQEAHLVSKYVGAGKARPALNTLGGKRWAKTKEQAELAVRDLAGELLSIQAARELQPGHAFAADVPWQREFESAFLFEETPDQMRAIQQTKLDMERTKPMDRLICGDVGFGKTEVAIRAAFKAVMGGKQAAVLVPTTVLAQQHFNTFRERMADYPIRIELLSRFRTPREQQRVLRDLAAGAVDIVIGTHRLVQPDVAFRDLGLVVIDEEQRFGVMHKEKFKLLRKLVDVLTLSATPIPRTLYLALTGARDMSTIETPPQDRLPVETIVAPYDERVIRDAIQRELNRQGQVFYLHNRVLDIDAVRLRLTELVPHARIVAGHGQMPAEELEEVMARFVNGEADVLLSTTIIESGLDIPNANTIIIDRADRFGLSDLYQLRGRVGRYKHQAYAYLLLPRHAGLLSDARKRISAIKQYSTLGSGFKLAMRDLEIRGAGNLLGAQQSGHITAVGFELYCQLLKQSVSALKGEKVQPRIDVPVRLDFLSMQNAEGRRQKAPHATEVPPSETPPSALRTPHSAYAYIPLNYVSDSRQRVEMYRKLAEVGDQEALEKVRAELRDRFGPLPDAVELLLQVTALRLLASQRGVDAIEVKDDKLMLTRHGDYVMQDGRFPRLTKRSARARLNEIKRVIQSL